MNWFKDLIEIIPKDTREMLGEYFGMWIFMVAPVIVVGGCILIYKIFSPNCWDIRELENKIIKINVCNGEFKYITNEKQGSN